MGSNSAQARVQGRQLCRNYEGIIRSLATAGEGASATRNASLCAGEAAVAVSSA